MYIKKTKREAFTLSLEVYLHKQISLKKSVTQSHYRTYFIVQAAALAQVTSQTVPSNKKKASFSPHYSETHILQDRQKAQNVSSLWPNNCMKKHILKKHPSIPDYTYALSLCATVSDGILTHPHTKTSVNIEKKHAGVRTHTH